MEPAAKIFSSVRLFTSGLDFQQLKRKQVTVHSAEKKKPPRRSSETRKNQKKETHSDVEAQEIADHSGDSGQDDHSGEVIDQRVDGQAQQPERSIQLLVEIRGTIKFSLY